MNSRTFTRMQAFALFSVLAIPVWLVAQAEKQAETVQYHYTVIDLGTLGGTFSWAMGINDKGWIDGFSTLPGETCVPFPPPPGCDEHAFVWRDGEMTDLGTLGGPNSGVSFWGRRPNDRGEVAGAAQTGTPDAAGEDYCNFINNFGSEDAAPFLCFPFVWQDGVMTPLPTRGENGSAAQINNRGEVAGQVDGKPDCPPGTPHPVPVLWEHAKLHKLPRLLGDPYSGPSAINDVGQSVGVSVGNCTGFPAHAVLWEGDRVINLGSLGGSQFDEGAGINNRGEVVGFSSLPGDLVWHAFFWSRGSGMKDLGTLPGDVLSFAAGINNRGQIVGTSFDANGNPRVFLEQDGVMIDLNTLTPVGSSLYLLEGFDINSHGEIVGLAIDSTTQDLHAFLARPCEENEPCRAQDTLAANRARTVRAVVPENVRRLLQRGPSFARFGIARQNF